MSEYEAEFPGFGRFLAGFVSALLWTATDDDGDPLDEHFGAADVPRVSDLADSCAAFLRATLPDGRTVFDALYPYDMGKAGHDFLLTRNNHGAGYWDGDYPDIGDALTPVANTFQEVDLYTGDDGALYLWPPTLEVRS